MREKVIAITTATKQINKARITGKISLTAVAKLNLFIYYIKFAKERIGLGDENYIKKLQELLERFNNLALSCPDIICNVDENVDGSYDNLDLTITNPYNPTIPSEPAPEPEPENEPATIGDYSMTVDSRSTTKLTLEMFTSQTAPPYNDPENDLIDAIRIDYISSTNTGKFYLDGELIVENTVITREQLAAELLTYVSPDSESMASDIFLFSARDEGSMKWIS